MLTANPTFREKLIKFAQQFPAAFYDGVAKYSATLVNTIREKDKTLSRSKVVLIIDSMERFTPSCGKEIKLFDSLKETFFHKIDFLRFPSFSVVYSVPPSARCSTRRAPRGFRI
jgi:hypothetical protein